MRILVIGNGAREHALVWKLKQSPRVKEVFCAPGNGGMPPGATCVPIDTSNIVELADFAEELNLGLTVVGPELALTLGIVDEFTKRGLRCFGPTEKAARLEGSKVFAKEFMSKNSIPTARYVVCDSHEDAVAVIRSGEFGYPVVLKADGLAAGKGVLVALDEAEALRGAERTMVERAFGNAGDRIVIEEHLEGIEVSFMVITDGRHVLPLASAQDYKRAYDKDQGPNTGGMGSFSPSRALKTETAKTFIQDIVYPTLKGMDADGRRFAGVLYVGGMLTAEGPKVLEFNVRFGDPETQAVLPRLESDLAEVLIRAVDGQLKDFRLKWRKEVTVCVVLASGGYPAKASTGFVIEGVEEAGEMDGVVLFHAGTELADGKLRTCAGRVLSVTATAPSLAAARANAYRAVEKIHFDDMMFRTDIALLSDTQSQY